jgi:4-amino-4-deoxychorismate lyase
MAPEAAWIDGAAATALPLDDRGFAYGDGLFETMRAAGGRIALWDLHLARLLDGCARLGLAAPEPAALAGDCAIALRDAPDALLKLVLTRGGGGRGYARPHAAPIRRILMRHPLPASSDPRGLRAVACATCLPLDPRLAGLKHLNRLHQVLARAEVDAAGADEGICLDGAGRVACATAANVFAVVDGVVCTPAIEAAGVAGVARAALLADRRFAADIRVGELWPEQLARASEVFLSNAVRGVQPLREFDGRPLTVGPAAEAARQALSRAGWVES